MTTSYEMTAATPEMVIAAAHELVRQVIADEVGDLNALEPHALYTPMTYILDLGGKRLRPLMTYLCFCSWRSVRSAEDTKQITALMKAVELFHNFTLLHDDVMDLAPLRRGAPTVFKKWGANPAILSGDGMMIRAYQALQVLEAESLKRLLPYFNDMAMGVCAGQQYDIDFEDMPPHEVGIKDYTMMIRLKTAYLFRGSMAMAALLAGAAQADVDAIVHAADCMGIAFQIMDDYLDIYASPEFGKRQGGDILEGKKTWLYLQAYSLQPDRMSSAMQIVDDDERIAAVRDIYSEAGVDQAARAAVQKYTDEACDTLYGITSADTSALQFLFRSLTARAV